jgi:hypothetical protein
MKAFVQHLSKFLILKILGIILALELKNSLIIFKHPVYA